MFNKSESFTIRLNRVNFDLSSQRRAVGRIVLRIKRVISDYLTIHLNVIVICSLYIVICILCCYMLEGPFLE